MRYKFITQQIKEMPEDWLEPQERQKQEAGQGEAAQKHTGPELWLAVVSRGK